MTPSVLANAKPPAAGAACAVLPAFFLTAEPLVLTYSPSKMFDASNLFDSIAQCLHRQQINHLSAMAEARLREPSIASVPNGRRNMLSARLNRPLKKSGNGYVRVVRRFSAALGAIHSKSL
jgi:hypothetical protein